MTGVQTCALPICFPVTILAELFYDKEDPSFIDKAVRAVIIVIIFVFDPLAVLLLIAANQTYRNRYKQEELPVIKKKAKKTKPLDNLGGNSLESFFVDENNEIIPKSKITKINGDFK